MTQLHLGEKEKSLPRIGFGCGRISTGSRFRESCKLIETAVESGIRYFDVAPSYGNGTADIVLGQVVADNPDIIIASKCGIPRPTIVRKRIALISFLKVCIDHMHPLKRLLEAAFLQRNKPSISTIRHDFSDSQIAKTLDQTLRNLKRTKLDIFLAHEPTPLDLTPEIESRFESLIAQGYIRSFGAGIGAECDQWSCFGKIWQSCWPGPRVDSYRKECTYVFHGLMRYKGGSFVTRLKDIERELCIFRDHSPNALLLFSASTPSRLRNFVKMTKDVGVF